MFHDVEQNTDEWLALRVGKMTGSAFSKIMANYGKAFGEPAKKYAVSIAIEQITGNGVSSGYSNEHMERGHEQEPLARMAYEQQMFCDVGNGGFFEFGDIGCSPDGLVGDNGLIEIKSVLPSTHYDVIRKQAFDPKYKWQLSSNLKITDREWVDFISFCPEFPEGKQLFIHRCYAEDFKEEYQMIDSRVALFRGLIEKTKIDILRNEYFVGEVVK